jgi:hypothetical protein
LVLGFIAHMQIITIDLGFGLIIGFIAHMQIITTSKSSAIAFPHTLFSSLQHSLSLLRLLFCNRLFGIGFQRRSFLSFRTHRLVSSWATFYVSTHLGVATRRLTTIGASPLLTSALGIDFL